MSVNIDMPIFISKPMKYLFPSNIWQVLLLLFLPLILSSPCFFLLMKMDLSIEKFIPIYFFAYTFTVIVFFFTISKIKKQPIDYDFTPRKTVNLGLFILLVICFQIGINIPLTKLMSFVLQSQIISESFHISSLELLGALFLAPILEEFIFRGIILRGLLSRYSSTKAIIVTAILFALIHINPTQILGAFILGLFFSWIYYYTKSIVICILLHFVANGTSILFQYSTQILSLNDWYFHGSSVVVFSFLAFKLFGRIGNSIE